MDTQLLPPRIHIFAVFTPLATCDGYSMSLSQACRQLFLEPPSGEGGFPDQPCVGGSAFMEDAYLT